MDIKLVRNPIHVFLIFSAVFGLIAGIRTFNGDRINASSAVLERVSAMLDSSYNYDLNTIIVVYKDKPGEFQVLRINSSRYPISPSSLANSEEYNLKKPKLQQALAHFIQNENILFAQPQYIYSIDWVRNDQNKTATPNDYNNPTQPLSGKHWYYEKSGLRKMWYTQECGNSASEGCGGDSKIIVAVLDTGLAFEDRSRKVIREGAAPTYVSIKDAEFSRNTDLFGTSEVINLYVNQDEVENNYIDDDDNGYIDDYHGFDAAYYEICKGNVFDKGGEPYNPCIEQVSPDPYDLSLFNEVGHPNDDNGHGSFVTGNIASLVDNSTGSVSPAFNISIMPVKLSFNYGIDPEYDFRGLFIDSAIYDGIKYAADNGADIINMSFGTPTIPEDPLFEEAINYAYSKGVVLVAASGNDADYGFPEIGYPAAFEHVIGVGAIDSNGKKSIYSQYGCQGDIDGSNCLDITAYVDGLGINATDVYQRSYSCFNSYTCGNNLINDFKAFMDISASGTSFASPQVAALAALVLSINDNLTSDQVAEIIYQNATDLRNPNFGQTEGWDEQTGWGVIDYYSTVNTLLESKPQLNYIEPDGSSDEFDIQDLFTLKWELIDNDDQNVTFSFYLDTDNINSDGIIINTCKDFNESSLDPENKGECTINSGDFQNGTYYIYACINDLLFGTDCNYYSTNTITLNSQKVNLRLHLMLERKNSDGSLSYQNEKVRIKIVNLENTIYDSFTVTDNSGISPVLELPQETSGSFTIFVKPKNYISQRIDDVVIEKGINEIILPNPFRVGDLSESSYDFINSLDFSMFIKYFREKDNSDRMKYGDLNNDLTINSVDYSVMIKTYRESRKGFLLEDPK